MEAQITNIINNQPVFDRPLEDIFSRCEVGGALKVLSPLEYHTSRQRKWYRGVCLKGLSQWSGDTEADWDLTLKAACGGNELLKHQQILLPDGQTVTRLTIQGVGKRNMTEFINNILSLAIEKNWPVTPPDAELRR